MCITVWLSSEKAKVWGISGGQLQRLKDLLPGVYVNQAKTQEQFLALLPHTETALTWHFEQSWFEKAPKLRYLVTPAAGLDYFSVDPPESVMLVNSSFHGTMIAETVIGMMLDHCRRIGQAAELMRREAWPHRRVADAQRRFSGSRITILGFGSIGEHISRLAKGFCCGITGIRRTPAGKPPCFGPNDRILSPDKLRDVLPETDHLVLALPRSPQTDDIVGAVELSLLPEHAALYNVGRGNAVDERALVEGLKKDRPAAAYLDVFKQEPLEADSPLRELSNCYLMPHVSAVAPEYLDLFVDEFAAKYKAWHR